MAEYFATLKRDLQAEHDLRLEYLDALDHPDRERLRARGRSSACLLLPAQMISIRCRAAITTSQRDVRSGGGVDAERRAQLPV